VDRTDRVDQIDRLDIVVKGRHTEVSDRFREHVKEKLARLERLDPKAYRIDVELCHESNPRLAGSADRVELTLRSKGPVVRAEAAAQSPYAALDLAQAKLEERLRRAADRRHTKHPHGHGAPPRSAGTAIPVEPLTPPAPPVASAQPDLVSASGDSAQRNVSTGDTSTGHAPDGGGAGERSDGDVLLSAGPLVVREKAHDATPISLDDALHRMELVGHDFYLYCDTDNGLPSLVYRRRGYTYGVLRLRTPHE
jgi:ribosomal subunit interface protein